MSIPSKIVSADINFKDPSSKQYKPILDEVINLVAKETNKPKEEIEKLFDKIYTKAKSNPGIAFPLRSSVFQLIDLLPPDKIPIEISLDEIDKVYNYIRIYIQMFRRIRDIFSGKIIRPVVIFVPNPLLDENSSFNSVTTGSASPNGDLIFNVNFIKKLVYIAELELKYKIIKIKSKIFESNGGKIQDKYVYVAFLIIHELFHLVQSDVEYLDKRAIQYICKNKEKYKATKNIPKTNCENNPLTLQIANQIQNIVADYFNNYNICRLGLPALPIGLFSNEINLEHMTYEQAYDV
ncbi:hypothetical protein [Hippea alviniae]|uniref:hypothetical protein n=1 Tax=Hippea alviniae TaxID=1279027 RepID=UPI0003B592B8|nr:hypothetical protein [Hippea alviniae]